MVRTHLPSVRAQRVTFDPAQTRSRECISVKVEVRNGSFPVALALVWYPAPSVQAHARIRITACACGKEGSGEMVYPSAGPGM